MSDRSYLSSNIKLEQLKHIVLLQNDKKISGYKAKHNVSIFTELVPMRIQSISGEVRLLFVVCLSSVCPLSQGPDPRVMEIYGQRVNH